MSKIDEKVRQRLAKMLAKTIREAPNGSSGTGYSGERFPAFLRHTLLWGGMSVVAMALGLSQRQSRTGIWTCAVIAAFLLLYAIRDTTKSTVYRAIWSTVVAAILFSGAFYLTYPQLPIIVFKETPPLSIYRNYRIQLSLSQFRDYLEALGFEVPRAAPPIGISTTSDGTLTGTARFPGTTFLNANELADEKEVIFGYAYAVFSRLFFGNQRGMGETAVEEAFASDLVANYFVYSYTGKIGDINDPITSFNWMKALWEIRSTLGQSFLDHALQYAAVQYNPPEVPVGPISGAETRDPNTGLYHVRGELGSEEFSNYGSAQEFGRADAVLRVWVRTI